MSGLHIHGPGSGLEAVGQLGDADKTVTGASYTHPIGKEAGCYSSLPPAGLRDEPHAPQQQCRRHN